MRKTGEENRYCPGTEKTTPIRGRSLETATILLRRKVGMGCWQCLIAKNPDGLRVPVTFGIFIRAILLLHLWILLLVRLVNYYRYVKNTDYLIIIFQDNIRQELGTESRTALCRVLLSNGSTTVVQIKDGEAIHQLIGRLLEKRGLSYSSYEVFTNKHPKVVANNFI